MTRRRGNSSWARHYAAQNRAHHAFHYGVDSANPDAARSLSTREAPAFNGPRPALRPDKGNHPMNAASYVLSPSELIRWRGHLKTGDTVLWPPHGMVTLLKRVPQTGTWDVMGEALVGARPAPERDLRPVPGFHYAGMPEDSAPADDVVQPMPALDSDLEPVTEFRTTPASPLWEIRTPPRDVSVEEMQAAEKALAEAKAKREAARGAPVHAYADGTPVEIGDQVEIVAKGHRAVGEHFEVHALHSTGAQNVGVFRLLLDQPRSADGLAVLETHTVEGRGLLLLSRGTPRFSYDDGRFIKYYDQVRSADGQAGEVTGFILASDPPTVTVKWSSRIAGSLPALISELTLVRRSDEPEAERAKPVEQQAFSAREIFETHKAALSSRAITETSLHTEHGRLFVTSAGHLRWNDESGRGEVYFDGVSPVWVPVTDLGIAELSRREHLHWRIRGDTVMRWDVEAEPYNELARISETLEPEREYPDPDDGTMPAFIDGDEDVARLEYPHYEDQPETEPVTEPEPEHVVAYPTEEIAQAAWVSLGEGKTFRVTGGGAVIWLKRADSLRWNETDERAEALHKSLNWFPLDDAGIEALARAEHLNWRRPDNSVFLWDAQVEPTPEEQEPEHVETPQSEPPVVAAVVETVAPAQPEGATVRPLALDLIRRDGETQPRQSIDGETVREYAEAMRENAGQFPAIDVFFDGADYWLADGFHRYYAALEASLHDLKATIHNGTLDDAQWFSYTANGKHGLRRSRADLQQAIDRALRHLNGAGKSDRELARHIGCSHATVGARRAHLGTTGQVVQSAERIGADGRTINTAGISAANAERAKPHPPAPSPLHGEGETAPEYSSPAEAHAIDPKTGEITPAAALDHIDPVTAEVTQIVPEVAQAAPSPREVLHSSQTNEWYTPARYLKAVREVMGGIDLDPASCEAANRNVQAAKFFTIEDDGLTQEWQGSVFLNPPYGKEDGESNQARWAAKLLAEFEAGRVAQAILLVNAATANDWFKRLWDFPICFTDHRIKFLSPEGAPQDSPTNGNAFVYLATDSDWNMDFAERFREFGPVVMETWR